MEAYNKMDTNKECHTTRIPPALSPCVPRAEQDGKIDKAELQAIIQQNARFNDYPDMTEAEKEDALMRTVEGSPTPTPTLPLTPTAPRYFRGGYR